MFELIISIILVLSLGGLLFILAKKIPVLVTLSQNGTTGFRRHQFILGIENRIKETLVYFEKQILLHKFLSWVKCMTLKVETKVDHLLHSIRRKAQEVDKELNEKK
jgi:hypothetical protein